MKEDKIVEIEGVIKHETERAFKFRFVDPTGEWKEVWVPKSQITDEDISSGTSSLWIKAWFATKEGMI